MAKQTVDPGFIGVPQFPRSTFDPVQFTRNLMAERRAKQSFESDRLRNKQKENIDFLRKQMGEVDIEAWEDKKGYDELSQRKQAVFAKAMDAANRGYNLYTPETAEETGMMREFKQDLEDLGGDVDIWNVYKGKLQELDKEAQKQMFMDPEAQTFDFEKYKEFREGLLNGEGSIQERAKKLEMFDFGRPKEYTSQQMNKYMSEEIADVIPGMDEQVKQWQEDPATGDIIKSVWTGVEPERIRTGLRKVYNRSGGKQREFLDQRFDQAVAEGFQGDLNDFMVETYAPEYAEKTSKTKIAGRQQKERMALAAARPPVDAAGNYDLSEHATTKRYGTQDAEGNTVTQSYQSKGTLPMMSIFKNKGFTMPVTGGTVVKSTGQKAPEAISAGTIPVDVSFIPTAVEQFSIEVDNPETGAKETVTIEAGDRIPEHVQHEMEMQNVLSGDGAYSYTIQPYVEANVYKSMMKDPANPNSPWEVPDPKSEKMTTIRPYNEARIHLDNFAAGVGVDFGAFDKDVRGIQKQLNKEVAQDNEKYQQLGL